MGLPSSQWCADDLGCRMSMIPGWLSGVGGIEGPLGACKSGGGRDDSKYLNILGIYTSFEGA